MVAASPLPSASWSPWCHDPAMARPSGIAAAVIILVGTGCADESGLSARSTSSNGIRAAPTVKLAETDEFGLVVRVMEGPGSVAIDVDRVDMLSGEEGERAAAADGADYSNDYYLVNKSPRTRHYVLGPGPELWQVDVAHADQPKLLTLSEWVAYLKTALGRAALFHLDVEQGVVVAIEEQYRP